MPDSRLKRFHHVTIVVADRDAAVADWEKALGGTAVGVRDEGAPRFVRRAQFNAGDAWFELAQPLHDRSPLWSALQERGEGPYSATVSVDDVAETAALAQAAGAKLIGDPAAGGPLFVDPLSVHGVLLELTANPERASGPRLWQAIHHIVLPTLDMDAAAGDFERLFGGVAQPSGPEGDMPLRSRHYMIGEAWFGLAQAFSPAHAVARFLRDRGQRIFAIGATTGDRERAVAEIRARGGQLLGPGLAAPGQQIFVHPKHTQGVLIDLW